MFHRNALWMLYGGVSMCTVEQVVMCDRVMNGVLVGHVVAW